MYFPALHHLQSPCGHFHLCIYCADIYCNKDAVLCARDFFTFRTSITVTRSIMFILGIHMIRDVFSRTTPLTTALAIFICVSTTLHILQFDGSHDGWRSYLTSIYLWDKRHKQQSCVVARYCPLGHLSQSLEASCSFWVFIWSDMYFPALHHLQSALAILISISTLLTYFTF